MAEQDEPVHDSSAEAMLAEGGGRSMLGAAADVLGAVVGAAVIAVAAVWNAMTDDGVLAGAARQGVDEIGAALKAFPDAIQTTEVGTIFSPTQGEIAAARTDGHEGGVFGHSSCYSSYSNAAGAQDTWPSEIASNSPPHDPGLDYGHGHGDGCSM